MPSRLHRLGIYCYTHKWRILLIWLVLLGITTGLMVKFQQPATSSLSIPGTEAQTTLDELQKNFPQAAGASARLVFEAPAGKTIADFEAPITESINLLKGKDFVGAIVSPFENPTAISRDKKIAYAVVQLKTSRNDVTEEISKTVTAAVEPARDAGMTPVAGGDITGGAPAEILGIGEIIGLGVAVIVLVITLGSLFAAGMPLITAILAVGIGATSLYALGQLVEINATTPVLAIMLGLAVGIDYSLFIISKYRRYLHEGDDYQLAAGKAIGTAGQAVLFAAATVVIALSALSVVQIPFMTVMGLAGGGTVALAALIAITLTPALLGMAGPRVFKKKARAHVTAAQERGRQAEAIRPDSFWHKWGEAITRHSIIISVLVIGLLAVIAIPVKDLKLGLPTDEFAAADTSGRQSYDILSRGFGPGFNGPLIVLAKGMTAPSSQDVAAAQGLILDQMRVSPEQAATYAALPLDQKEAMLRQAAAQAAQYKELNAIAEKIKRIENVVAVQPAGIANNGTTGILQVVPETGPSDAATEDLINTIRDRQSELAGEATLGVSGSTAVAADINSKLASALPVYMAVVVGLSFILLIVAFRSLLIPLKATLGFVLSILATLGALVAVFQWGWFGIADYTPIISFLPIISVGILFGLAMDYQFFLVSSMRESYEAGSPARAAVVDGFSLGAKVVTAAALIMIAVFSGFIANHDEIIRQIGFSLAFGVLVDAFIVRMTLVPAIMTLMGDAAWKLPKWLGKLIPKISIEGQE